MSVEGNGIPTAALRVFVTGFEPSLGDLCDALVRHPEVELVGVAAYPDEAAWALGGGQVDVVLQATAGAVPYAELAAIRSFSGAPVLLLATAPTMSLFEEALEADVADVVLLPQPTESLVFAIHKAARVPRREAAPKVEKAKILTVFAPKGGIGKTVVATNLSSSLAKHAGRRTLLIDLDLQFGDAAIMLGIEPEATLHDIVTAPGELDSEKLRGYLTRHTSGLDLLAAPLRPEDGELVSEAKVEELIGVATSMYEVIVVDTSPFFHGPMLSTLDLTDDLLMVCSPEVPTLKNVRLGLETLKLLSYPSDRIRLVLNRADAEVGMKRGEVETALGIPVAFELPSVHEVPAAVNRGDPLALSSPGSEFARAVGGMISMLVDGRPEAPAQERRDVFGGLRNLAAGLIPGRSATPAPAPVPERSLGGQP